MLKKILVLSIMSSAALIQATPSTKKVASFLKHYCIMDISNNLNDRIKSAFSNKILVNKLLLTSNRNKKQLLNTNIVNCKDLLKNKNVVNLLDNSLNIFDASIKCNLEANDSDSKIAVLSKRALRGLTTVVCYLAKTSLQFNGVGLNRATLFNAGLDLVTKNVLETTINLVTKNDNESFVDSLIE